MRLLAKDRYVIFASGIIVFSVFLGVLAGTMAATMAPRTTDFGSVVSEYLFPSRETVIRKQAARIVSQMDSREKLGQLVMIGIHGTDVTNDAAYMLKNYHVGNIVLFDRNLQSYQQTAKLTADLQKLALEDAKQPVPLFIGIDEEGGPVVRGRGIIPPPPSQMELAQRNNMMVIGQWADKTGNTLKALGINVNFAPVADVCWNNPRCYSGDPEIVSKCITAAANGYVNANEVFVLKHFPGIGRGKVDSHKDVSNIDVSKELLLQTDLKPFLDIIDNFRTQDFFIMVSHLKYPQLDPDNTASQSYNIITRLLRNELGYDGLIITDDMEMGAVAKYESYRQMGVNAIKAGADIVMICHDYNHQAEVYKGLVEAYDAGELDKKQIDDAVRRVVQAKLRCNTPL
ncbi:MAG: glycoside hydrolase family 3 protein [Anaerovibrio sp.]|uniref:glycoside hydrolase family 3 N-terminal domain-containing protein n=1 Tax=Anaerovibrio sp. TaxID=1872532 RepID=UPI00260137FD|nr:glycoside hydrolase family 3 N-terminal domain-containing protein [Anaerovibrio sp.]MCR5176951.1 glycoside hydrolase family 3 protein [Anaerovibrio sp.]